MKTLILFAFFALTLQPVFAQRSTQEREANAILALEEAAQNLSSKDLTCKTTADCQLLEIGSKSCGGPQGYLVASKKNHNFGIISQLANESVDREAKFNIKYSIMSDCMALTVPAYGCVSKMCIETGLPH